MASLINNNNETTNTDNFITWYNSQKKGQDEEGSIISAQIIAQYLETMNFPNNDSGLIIITECLKKINRENGLSQALEFTDLFIPEFRSQINTISYERKLSPKLFGGNNNTTDDNNNNNTNNNTRIDNPVKNVNNLPVAGSFSGFRLIDGGCDSWKEKKVPHTWSPIPGNLFQVRGPNYMVDQIKVASSYSIFEPTAVEVFDAPCTLDFPADHFYQNKVPSTGNTNGVPNRLVVSLVFPNFPAENPLWGTKKEDGPSHHVIMWYELTERAKKEYATKKDSELSPGLRMAKQYLQKDDPLHSNTKTIVKLANPKEVDLGLIANALVYKFNAKPFLSNKSHKTRISDDCFEISMSVHTFGHGPRSYYFDNYKYFLNWVSDVAIVVEGRKDQTELPEQILACCRIVCPNPNKHKFTKKG